MPASLTATKLREIGDEIAYGRPWPYMRVWKLHETDRAAYLMSLCAFVDGTHHDYHGSDWDGRPRDPGVNYLRERLKPQGFVQTTAVPMSDRKPNAHYPLGCQVTRRFTEMLLGEGRQPTMLTSDPVTDRYLEAIFDASDTWDSLQEGRDVGGGCGSNMILLSIEDGQPMSEVLHPADCWVVTWKPGPYWKPAMVVEQRLVVEDKLDPETGTLKPTRVWKTRAWDEEYSYTYEDVPEKHGEGKDGKPQGVMGNPGNEDDRRFYNEDGEGNDGEGEIPIALDDDGNPMVFEHKMGRCPVHWFQNTRNTKSPEGRPDNAGAYHLGDRVDRLQSMTVRASISNVDPTLVYSDEQRLQRSNPLLKKGWGNVIRTGPTGKASFLETTGDSIKMGWDGVHEMRDQYLQTVGCVLVDAKTAGTYKSGEALQLLWRAMEAAVSRKRVPLQDGISQLGQTWIHAGLQHKIANAADADSDGGIILPPYVVEPDKPVAAGADGKKPPPKRVAHEVGSGRYVETVWPPYHAPTPAQLLALMQALAMATGQKPVLSQQTAVETMVNYLGKGDASDEYEQILAEAKERQEQFGAAMFADNDDDKKEDAKDAEAAADREANRGAEKKGTDAGGDGE